MVKCWFIDLDDSIFEASGGMLHAIHLKMDEYMVNHLGFSRDKASELRHRYWSEYGATFLGLWKCHGVDPKTFLRETHDFDLSSFVHVDGSPATDLRALSGRRVVFTNGPRIYAEQMLNLLGLNGVIDDLITSTDMLLFQDWRPKPNRSMLRSLCCRYGVFPSECALIDDSPNNLKMAHSIGLKTVWCTGYRYRNGRLKCRRRLSYVDFMVSHIRELRRLPINNEKSCLNVSTPATRFLMRSVD